VPACPASGHILPVLKYFFNFTACHFLSSGFAAPFATIAQRVPRCNGQLCALRMGVTELLGATFAAH
jgi:hypothetical protein